MRTVVVFCFRYPLGLGEEFLGVESDYLRERFDRVVLVPQVRRGPQRALPGGVECDDSIARQTASLLRRCLRYPRRVCTAAALRELVCRKGPRRIADVGRLAVFLDRARLVEEWLTKQMQQGRFDPGRTVFYSYWLLGAAYAVVRMKRRTPGLRIVARAHSGDLYREGYYPAQEELLSGLDFVFPISEYARDAVARRCAALRNPPQVARLGSRRPKSLARRSENGTLNLLSCSNIAEVKRLDVLIESLSELARLKPETRVRWTHLGGGPLDGRMRALAQRMLAGTCVSWEFRGRLTNPQVFEYYATEPVDFLLNTSCSEGVPVSMMEAQSHGVPIVAMDVGAVREIVSGESGVLLPGTSSPRRIAEAVLGAASDADRLRRWRRAARRNWEERFDAENNYRAFASRLSDLLPPACERPASPDAGCAPGTADGV